MGTTFEEYLASKKIDSRKFQGAEPDVWAAWKIEFEQMHPNSFTVQKLNLINPIRRKYMLPPAPEVKKVPEAAPTPAAPSPAKPGRPVIKPRTS
jgi:hypothetical protein